MHGGRFGFSARPVAHFVPREPFDHTVRGSSRVWAQGRGSCHGRLEQAVQAGAHRLDAAGGGGRSWDDGGRRPRPCARVRPRPGGCWAGRPGPPQPSRPACPGSARAPRPTHGTTRCTSACPSVDRLASAGLNPTDRGTPPEVGKFRACSRHRRLSRGRFTHLYERRRVFAHLGVNGSGVDKHFSPVVGAIRRADRNDDCGRCDAHRAVGRAPIRASRRLLRTTLTLLNAMAALAMIGESSHPVNGYSTPAAIGMPMTL